MQLASEPHTILAADDEVDGRTLIQKAFKEGKLGLVAHLLGCEHQEFLQGVRK